MSSTQSEFRPGSDHNPIFGIEILKEMWLNMYFMNSLFIWSDLHCNSKVGSQSYCI